MRIMRRAYARLQYTNAIRLSKEGGSIRIDPSIAKQAGVSELVAADEFDVVSRHILGELGRTLVISEKDKPSRVLTTSMVTHATSDLSQHSYIAAVCITAAKRVAIAWADSNDGSLWFQESSMNNLQDDLARVCPKQVVLEAAASVPMDALELYPIVRAKFPRQLTGFSGLFDSWQSVKHVTGTVQPSCLAALAGLLGYLMDSNSTSLKLDTPREYLVSNALGMDKRARITLELSTTASGSTKGSLYNVIKRTKTQSGARLLHELLTSPLRDIDKINSRLDTVESLLKNPMVLAQARDSLRGYPDGKLCIQRLNGEPSARHLLTWAQCIEGMKHMVDILEPYPEFEVWTTCLRKCIQATGVLSAKICKYMDFEQEHKEDPGSYQPIFLPEISKPLMALYKTNQDFDTVCVNVLEKYSGRYDSAKVQWLPSLGYHILVKGQPHAQDLILRGGKKTSRLQDDELALAGKIREEFEQRLEQLERKLLLKLQKQVNELNTASRAGLDIIDEIDLLQSFASLALDHNLVRPSLTEEPIFDIVGGRHIAVEEFMMLEEGSDFVPNDCKLIDTKVCMVTGPNMGGKSTYMRQMATISVLAHMGCYVPAQSATIGVIDKIFCRIGSGDDGFRGQSTFMIEMLETSHILWNATPSSLAMLDEVGRGTSKRDGVSLAYASIHHIVTENRCRALFATHFGPPLKKLLQDDGLNVAMQQSIDYKMVGGVCTDSRGLGLAKVANFPKQALEDAIRYVHKRNQ